VSEEANEYSGQIALRGQMTYHRRIQFEARNMADSIQQAIKLIEASKFDQAHALLLEKLQVDPKNDVAWYWMSKVVATDDLREECLQEALK
jgi:Tfp pilus assembly protein PilF